jgi:predicted GNAT family acetyltransferase
LIVREKGELAGVCTIKKVNDIYDEIAVLYMFEKYRNQGFGSVLLAQTIEKIHAKGKKVFCN